MNDIVLWMQMMASELSTVTQKLAGVQQPEAPSTSSPKDRKRKRAEDSCTAASVPLEAIENLHKAAEENDVLKTGG